MSYTNEMGDPWTLDDLELDENDLALAAEILGYPQSNNSAGNGGDPVSQEAANPPTTSNALGQDTYSTFNQNYDFEFSGNQQQQSFDFLNMSVPEVIGTRPLQSPSDFLPPLSPPRNQPNAALDIHRLISQNDNGCKGHISSYQEHLTVKDAYMKLNDEEIRGNILDFPLDDQGQKELARQLYQAMTNMDDILDGTRLSRKRRQTDEEDPFSVAGSVNIDRFEDSVAVKRVKETKEIELEMIAWDLLFAIRDAQLGQDSIPAWSKDWERKRYGSFMERFNQVALSLTKAKTVVSSLLNVGFMKRLAAAPERELHRKKDNKRLNLDRDISVKAGNYARKQGLVNVNEDHGIKASNGLEIAPPNPLSAHLQTPRRSRGRRPSGGLASRRPSLQQHPQAQSVGALRPSPAYAPTSSSSSFMTTPASASYAPATWSATGSGAGQQLNTTASIQTELNRGAPVPSGSLYGFHENDPVQSEYFDMGLFPELSQNQTSTTSFPNMTQPTDFGNQSAVGDMFADLDWDMGLDPNVNFQI